VDADLSKATVVCARAAAVLAAARIAWAAKGADLALFGIDTGRREEPGYALVGEALDSVLTASKNRRNPAT